MRFRSGEGEVSVRKSEKAIDSRVFPDREPPARAAVEENQIAKALSNKAFQPSKKRPV
jgi:hypothetical protein